MYKIITNLSGLNDGWYDAKDWHDDDGRGKIHVVIRHPKRDRENLKYIEGVQDFQEQELENAGNFHFDLIIPVDDSPNA